MWPPQIAHYGTSSCDVMFSKLSRGHGGEMSLTLTLLQQIEQDLHVFPGQDRRWGNGQTNKISGCGMVRWLGRTAPWERAFVWHINKPLVLVQTLHGAAGAQWRPGGDHRTDVSPTLASTQLWTPARPLRLFWFTQESCSQMIPEIVTCHMSASSPTRTVTCHVTASSPTETTCHVTANSQMGCVGKWHCLSTTKPRTGENLKAKKALSVLKYSHCTCSCPSDYTQYYNIKYAQQTPMKSKVPSSNRKNRKSFWVRGRVPSIAICRYCLCPAPKSSPVAYLHNGCGMCYIDRLSC